MTFSSFLGSGENGGICGDSGGIGGDCGGVEGSALWWQGKGKTELDINLLYKFF